MSKLCSICNTEHDRNHSYCLDCFRAYKKGYGKRAYKHRYNPDQKRQYYAENREERLAYQRAYFEAHPDYQRTWAESNRARVAAHGGKNCALNRAPDCLPDNFDFEATIPFYELRIRVTGETGVAHHVDHIIPLEAGGLHEASNLQVLRLEGHTYKNHNVDGIFREEKQ